jgi:GNAT superfamily N-acetyltransferase
MDEGEWEPYENWMKSVLRKEPFRQLWERAQSSNNYQKEFVKRVNEWMKAERGPYLHRMVVHEVTDTGSGLFEDAMRLYESSFPVNERETVDRVGAWVSPGGVRGADRYHLLVLCADGEASRVAGLAMFHYLDEPSIGFLGYLAVDEKVRNRSYGSVLLASVRDVLVRDAELGGRPRPRGLFTELERESPDDPSTTDRFRFWRLHHMLPLTMQWEYPSLRPGENPANMCLAFLPMASPHLELTREETAAAARAIYKGVYGAGPDHPGLCRILSGL